MKLRVRDHAHLPLLSDFLKERGCVVSTDFASPADAIEAEALGRKDDAYVIALAEEWQRRTPGSVLEIETR